jgi:hypothetical protein
MAARLKAETSMNKLKSTLLAAGILLPFLALGAIGEATGSSQDAMAPVGTVNQACCVVYFMGQWWCIPC